MIRSNSTILFFLLSYYFTLHDYYGVLADGAKVGIGLDQSSKAAE